MPGDSESPVFKLLIEEYKSLREEIGRFQNQEKQLVIAAIAGVGAIGAGFLKENSLTEKYADFFLLGPLFFGTIGVLFLQAERGIYRAAYYTGIELRNRAKGPCKTIQEVLEWERFRVINEDKLGETEPPESTDPQFLPFYLPPILLFGIPSVLCFIAFFCFGGLSKGHDDSTLHRTGEVILGSVGLLIFFSYCVSFWKTSVDGETLNAHALSLPERAEHPKSATTQQDGSPREGQAMKVQSNDNPALEDWKRVRSAMEHENLLINHRLTWWLSAQGGLLVVTGLIFPHILSHVDPSPPAKGTNILATATPLEPSFQIMLVVLMLIGILTSLFFWRAVRAAQAAQAALAELAGWWNKEYVIGKTDEKKHPPICGTEPLLPLRGNSLLEYHDLPFTFAFVWLIVGLAIIVPALFQNIISQYIPLFLWLLGAFAVSGAAVWRFREKNTRVHEPSVKKSAESPHR